MTSKNTTSGLPSHTKGAEEPSTGEYAPGPGVAPGAAVAAFLRGYRFRYSNEKEMQDGIAQLLAGWPVAHRREVALTRRDIIDFLLVDGVGLEVKTARRAGTREVLRQLDRYAERPEVVALVLITDRTQLTYQPHLVRGKPLYIVKLRTGLT